MKSVPELLIFDVNETLLSMEPIKKAINEKLRSISAFDHWFATLIQFSLVESLTGEYRDFGVIGAACLTMTAQKFAVDISEDEINIILRNITQLPPHPETIEALKKLKYSGYKLATLTNGGFNTVEKQLEFSKIKDYFDGVYSVEAVGKFKPHPDTYNHVLRQQNVKPGKSMLIAAHAWDIIGAQRAGLMTGFVGRKGKSLYPIGGQPEISGHSLSDIAQALSK